MTGRRVARTVTLVTVLLMATVALAAGTSHAVAGAGQSRTWPSEGPPRAGRAKDLKFPPYEIRTLPNGMRVVIVMHHEQPIVSMRLIVGAGAAHDPAGQEGVASLTTNLLDQGTTTRTARQVADTIDSVGGSLQTGTGRDLSYASVRVMKDSFGLGIGLLADIVRDPAFDEAEIERQRKQALSVLAVSYEDPEYVADVVFDRLVYGANPYGAPGTGTPQSLARLSRREFQAFHRRWYVPNNCLLAIVGDITVEDALREATRAFGDWPKRELPAYAPPAPPQPARRVIVVDKPDAVQTAVRVGHLGVPRKQSDYVALDLMTKILGGEGANRLYRVLRMERGLTYGASATMETLKRAGQFVASTNTRSDATGQVLRLIVDEFNALRQEPVGDAELAGVKAYVSGSFPLQVETADDIAMQVLNVLFYDLPVDELDTYRQRVNAVDAADIERMAMAYLRPDRLSVVVVGNASAFVDTLKGAGFGKFEVIPAADLDVSSADLRRHSATSGADRAPSDSRAPADARAGPSQVRTSGGLGFITVAMRDEPHDILFRAIRAKGGVDRLRAVKTVVMKGTIVVGAPQPVTAQMTNSIEYPDRFRQDATLPSGPVTQVYSRGETWMRDGRGVHDVPPAARENLAATVSRDLLALLLAAADGALRVQVMPRAATDAPNLDVLRVAGRSMAPVDLLIDRTTGMIAGKRYIVEQPGPAGRVPTEERYSDYRQVNGLMVAFKTVVRRGEAVILEQTLSDLQVNVPIAPDAFARPSR